MNRLPPYARPLFLRIRKNMDLTGTFKYSRPTWHARGSTAASEDAVYFNNLESGAFTRLDQQLYERIQMLGAIRF